jgi:hypothetical protein
LPLSAGRGKSLHDGETPARGRDRHVLELYR